MTVSRPRGSPVALLVCLVSTGPALAQSATPLLPAGTASGLPLVEPNGNTAPAGTMGADGVREIALEVVRADWRPETPDWTTSTSSPAGSTGPSSSSLKVNASTRAPTT